MCSYDLASLRPYLAWIVFNQRVDVHFRTRSRGAVLDEAKITFKKEIKKLRFSFSILKSIILHPCKIMRNIP